MHTLVMDDIERYDLAIIGSGPAGYTAAEKTAKEGYKVVLFEKADNVGGVCLNEGCIPTKTLLYSAKILDQARQASKYGVLISGEIKPDVKRMVSREKKVVRKLVLGIKQRLENAGVIIIKGEAYIKSNHKIVCNDSLYYVENMFICTGSESIIPPIVGLEDVPYWTHKDPLECTDIPDSIVILGGGVIGMEFASYFNSMGSKVTVIEMMNELLPMFDAALVMQLREIYAKRGVEFLLSTKVTAVAMEGEKIAISTNPVQEATIVVDKLLVCTGRKRITAGFGLENLKLDKDDKGNILQNKRMQTSSHHIYLCGDANGKSMLAHTAIREAEVAVHTLLGGTDEINYQCIPSVLYTNPELAGVGYTEQELKKKGIPYILKELPMAYSGRFVAENEGMNGTCRILINPNDQRIWGVHLLGNPASEIIIQAANAIRMKRKASEWKRTVFPHPTVGEIIKECL